MSAILPFAGFLDVLPPACDVLRPYQRQQLRELSVAMHAGHRRVLIELPTGGGKTHEIAGLGLCASQAGLRILVLATRTRLVRQIHERMDEFGVPHGVIAAPLPEMRNYSSPVQVASVDTLHRRCVVDKHMPLPAASVIVFDEAHLAVADSRLGILERYPDALRVGFTATPARKSGRSLGSAFDHLIRGPSTLDLIAGGQLVRPRVFNVPVVTEKQLSEVPRDAANDYASEALGDLLSRPKLTGDVRANWLRLAEGRRTIVFACSKAHAADLTQEFCRAGVAAELLTDQDDEDTREAVFSRLASGQTRVVCNVFLAAYGIDLPAVSCIVLARPTRSVAMYLQMTGRGLRTSEGKTDCLVIDHGRVVEQLGLPHQPRDWTLDPSRNINLEALARTSRKNGDEKPRTCAECAYIWLVSEDGNACSQCGWAPSPKAKGILVEDADLGELELDPHSTTAQSPEVSQFFREAMGDFATRKPEMWMEAENKARFISWCDTAEKFGLKTEPVPTFVWRSAPMPPTAAVSSWLKYRRIRYAKGQEKARRSAA
jgi:DNA repair protein RadD